MAVNLSKMTKADLIKLLQEKETKIEKLKTENNLLKSEKAKDNQSLPTTSIQSSPIRYKTRKQTKRNNSVDDPLDEPVFNKILKVFNGYGFNDYELREKVTIEEFVEQLKPLPRREVYQKLC